MIMIDTVVREILKAIGSVGWKALKRSDKALKALEMA